jgi:transketolase
MELPTIAIFTHDSIGVGEDGPTHQPIEHLAALRAMPGLVDLRPGDANEVVEAWRWIMESRHDAVALILSRQNMPTLDRSKYAAAVGLHRGAYVLADAANGGDPEVILIATGSEVHVALEAARLLTAERVRVRVVSMPSWELFAAQPAEYRDAVLPPAVRTRVAVEAASPFGWLRWTTDDGAMLGMEGFGASAPADRLFQEFNFTPERAAARVRELLVGRHGAAGREGTA